MATGILAVITALATAVGYWFQKRPTPQQQEIQQARKDEAATNSTIDAWASKPSGVRNDTTSKRSPGNGKS